MTAAIAQVPTTSASRYLQQLCKHWSHRLEVEFDETHGTIKFPGSAVATMDAHAETLDVRIDVTDPTALDRMKGVIEEHLNRFAFREAPLLFAWTDAA